MNDEIKISCEKCGGHISFTSESLGQTVLCPHCNSPIQLNLPANAKEQQWNYYIGKKSFGPCSIEQIKTLLASGAISPSTLISSVGGDERVRISESPIEQQWNYYIGKKSFGPCSIEQIKTLLASSIITQNTIICSTGSDERVRISESPLFSSPIILKKSAIPNVNKSISLTLRKVCTIHFTNKRFIAGVSITILLIGMVVWYFGAYVPQIKKTEQDELALKEASRIKETTRLAESNRIAQENIIEIRQNAAEAEERIRLADEKRKADERAISEDWRIRTWNRQDRIQAGLSCEPINVRFDRKVEYIATWFTNTGLYLLGSFDGPAINGQRDNHTAEPWPASDGNKARYFSLRWVSIDLGLPFCDVCYGPESKQIVQIDLFFAANITDLSEHTEVDNHIRAIMFRDAIRSAFLLVSPDDVHGALQWFNGYLEDGKKNLELVRIGNVGNMDIVASSTVSWTQGFDEPSYKEVNQHIIIVPKGNRFIISPVGIWTGYRVPGSGTSLHGIRQFVPKSQWNLFDIH
jgi:hypothetical protein